MALSLPTPVGHLLDADTLALWRLDEALASAAAGDETSGYTLTAIAGVPAVVPGKIGNARAFTINQGITNAINITPTDKVIAALRSGTYKAEAWFWVDPSVTYPATWPGAGNNHAALLSVNGAPNGTAFMFGLGPTGFFIYNISHGFDEVGSWSALKQGTWHHLAVRARVLNATQSSVDFFVDGVFLVTKTIATYALTPSSNCAFCIGGESTGFNCFTGRIDDVRFSKAAGTDAEIFDNYRRGALGLGPATVSPISKITDHATRAATALIEQYKDKPRVIGLLTALVNQVQKGEDGIWPALAERNLQCASGAELDLLGSIVGEPRLGRADVSYRTFVQAKILLNISSGTVEELYAIFALLIAVNSLTCTMQIAEHFPKALTLRLQGAAVPDSIAADMAKVLKSGKDAGARAFLDYSPIAPLGGFDGATGFDGSASFGGSL